MLAASKVKMSGSKNKIREIKDVYGQEGRPVWGCITFLACLAFFKLNTCIAYHN